MTRLLAVLLVLGVAGACGPIRSTSFLMDADVQIAAARTAGAEKSAPYEWTAANLYLEKAREEVGYSDFEVALQFAEKAAKYATEARELAMAASNKDDASATPAEPAPGQPVTAP